MNLFLYIIFSFVMSRVSNSYSIYSVSYHIQQYGC